MSEVNIVLCTHFNPPSKFGYGYDMSVSIEDELCNVLVYNSNRHLSTGTVNHVEDPETLYELSVGRSKYVVIFPGECQYEHPTNGECDLSVLAEVLEYARDIAVIALEISNPKCSNPAALLWDIIKVKEGR